MPLTPEQEKDEAAKRIAERSVVEIAQALGITVDAKAIVEKAMLFVDTLKGGTWKKVLAEGEAAADKVNTLDDAVDAARKRK